MIFKTFQLLLIIAFLALAYIILGVGIERHEQAECYKWQRHASTISGYYLADWQAEQCTQYDIEIDAPVFKSGHQGIN